MEEKSMFLTDAELAELTGYKRAQSQMQWLGSNGHQFVLNGIGRVIVSRRYIESILGVIDVKKRKAKTIEPDWEAARS